jgi:hypothetical protein
LIAQSGMCLNVFHPVDGTGYYIFSADEAAPHVPVQILGRLFVAAKYSSISSPWSRDRAKITSDECPRVKQPVVDRMRVWFADVLGTVFQDGNVA